MNNIALKNDLNELKSLKGKVSVTKTTFGGNSISIINTKTNEEVGNYIYYGNADKRDEDYNNLLLILN